MGTAHPYPLPTLNIHPRRYTYKPLEDDDIRLLQLHSGAWNTGLVVHLDIYRLERSETYYDDEDSPAVIGSEGEKVEEREREQEQGEGEEGKKGDEVEKAEGNKSKYEFWPYNRVGLYRHGRVSWMPPGYDALSYTWGNEKPSLYITIYHGIVPFVYPITPNLEAALRYFRSLIPHGETQHLWVDALCIDQENDAEKSIQIDLMREIYQRADTVRVWLGEEADDSNKAIGLIKRLLGPDVFDQLQQNPITGREWTALRRFMQRPWFNRRWIIQEIALARKATIYCGLEQVAWDALTEAVALLTNVDLGLNKLTSRISSYTWDPRELSGLSAKRLLDVTNHIFRKSADGSVYEHFLSLEELVFILSDFEASDPRDIVYATLWLSYDAWGARRKQVLDTPITTPNSPATDSINDSSLQQAELDGVGSETFLIDYSLPIYEVYKQFLEFVVKRSKSLDIICRPWALPPLSTKHSSSKQPGSSLPSWMPPSFGKPFALRPFDMVLDRVAADTLVGKPGVGPRMYSASGRTRAYRGRDRLITDRALHVVGFVVERIEQIEDAATWATIPSSWLDLAGWVDDKSLPEDFWRTLVADRGSDGYKPAPSYFRGACEWAFRRRVKHSLNARELLIQGNCNPVAKEFLQRVEAVIWDRRLMRSGSKAGGQGMLGLVPKQAVQGDLICILYGCSVPVVLRHVHPPPTRRTSQEAMVKKARYTEIQGETFTNEYTLVGECYIHGIMSGEAFRTGSPIQEFRLI